MAIVDGGKVECHSVGAHAEKAKAGNFLDALVAQGVIERYEIHEDGSFTIGIKEDKFVKIPSPEQAGLPQP